MRRRRGRSWLVGVGLVAAVVFCGPRPACAGSAEEKAAVDAASDRWRGASCRTRVAIELKKKKGEWARCKWLFFVNDRAAADRAEVLVSDAAAAHRAFPGGVIPAGTEFVSTGLVIAKGDVAVELESPGSGLRLRAFYLEWKKSNSGFRRLGPKRLEQFERWARYEFLDVFSNPSEELVEVPVEASRPPAGGFGEAETVGAPAPTVELVGVSVHPARVVAGSEVGLDLRYSVSGAIPAAGVDVVEMREILFAGERIAVFEETLRRTAGSHSSSQVLVVPAGAVPGAYTLRATVLVAGRESAGSATFEVEGR